MRCSRARVPRGSRLIWEYQFRYGSGRPPWASGMAQAVAAQALARSSVLLEDPSLGAAAVRAFASVPPFLLSLPSGPWIRLYGFNGEVVLNAQLQSIVSLLDYATTSGNAAASALAQRLSATAESALPALRHRRLVALRARRRLRPARLPEVRHRPAREACEADRRSVLGRDRAAVPCVLLRPAAGDAAHPDAGDLAPAARRVPRRRADPDQSLDARLRHARGRRQGRDLPPERGHANAHVEAACRPSSRARIRCRSRR